MTIAPLRWGVLGATSFVARVAVLPALRASGTADVLALGSRSVQPEFRSYDSVVADPDVEAVYIALPNALHLGWTLRCAAAGKHVLCEKPLAIHGDQAEEMRAACAAAGVVLMEAYMTPFLPRSASLLDTARAELGALQSARAVFTFALRDPGNHRWRPDMGGGALLDVGIYCLSPLLALAGRDPVQVRAEMRRSASGVDATCEGELDFGAGFAASFLCSFEMSEQQTLDITGSRGALSAERIFTGAEDDADPYQPMVEHFAAVVRGAAAPRHDIADTVRLARLVDAVREAAPST